MLRKIVEGRALVVDTTRCLVAPQLARTSRSALEAGIHLYTFFPIGGRHATHQAAHAR